VVPLALEPHQFQSEVLIPDRFRSGTGHSRVPHPCAFVSRKDGNSSSLFSNLNFPISAKRRHPGTLLSYLFNTLTVRRDCALREAMVHCSHESLWPHSRGYDLVQQNSRIYLRSFPLCRATRQDGDLRFPVPGKGRKTSGSQKIKFDV